MNRLVSFLLAGTLAALGLALPAEGELSEQQRTYLSRLKEEIDQAARLFKQEEFDKSQAQVERCQIILGRLADGSNDEMLAALQPAHARLQKAHTLFAAQGIELPPLVELGESAANPADPPLAAASVPSAATSAESAREISFTQQIAPILVTRCGGCHVGRSMGEFSMATFASLAQGAESGPVLAAGNPDESTLLDLIESGEMPPPRPRPRPVPKAEIDLIRAWIAQGAKYDGQREDERLLDVVPPEVARSAAGPGGRGGPGGGRPMRAGR